MRWRHGESYFAKFIFVFSIFVLLLTGVSASLLLTKSRSVMIEEISKDSQHRLDNIRDYLQHTLLPKYEALLMEMVLSTLSPYSEEAVPFFLTGNASDSGFRIAKFNADLDIIRHSNEGVFNITLYVPSSETIIGSDYYYENLHHSADAIFISSLSEQVGQSHKWLYRERNETSLLTYVYTLPYLSEGQAVKGYLYIDLDVGDITDMLNLILSTSSEQLYVYDDNNQLLFSTAADGQSDRQLFEQTLNPSHASGFDIVDTANESLVVAYSADLSVNDWRFVVTRPLHSFLLSSQSMQRTIVIVCACVAFFGLIVAFLLSRFFYKPWKRLIFNIQHVYTFPWLPDQKNEYQVVDTLLHHLDQQFASFHHKLKDTQLFHLLRGNMREIDDTPVPLDAYHVAAYIQVKNQSGLMFIEKYRASGHSISHEIVCLSQNEVAIIYSFEEQITDYTDGIQRELEKFKLVTGYHFIIGIGSMVPTVEEISSSFQQATYAITYIFLDHEASSFSYTDVSELSQVSSDLQLDQFKNALHAGELNNVSSYLQDFKERLSESNVTVEAATFAFKELVMRLFQVMLEHRIQDPQKTANDLYTECKQETLERSLQVLYRHCKVAVAFIQNAMNPSHAETIQEMQRYIRDHLKEDISLDVLSERFSYSPSYISTLFREVLHQSFTGYVTQVRLDKAAELLLERTLTIQKIAEHAGFKNSQYFATRFKSRYGVTPSQYRDSSTPKTSLS
ncbi:AraC family transcriptional regulator [Paenibacillus sp. IB182496]|uniref:AraC family transcriptional regulator n=1 Tax=Paenibacillus sabuli TaxID=2772509 RepID=A0A927GT74_9BACL|nr:helix-turn-helix domain-containing protein [Paenibacillus sabuli]MBD2847514.1 AraC family transcriptional regulator [Paenibacillus sabuli]